MSAADQMLSAFRETSKSHVAAQPGSFIGVVLQKPAPDDANGLPVWSTYAFPTLEALTSWYDDWVGTPALYGYLAAIDRSRSSDEPIFEAGAGARIASGHDRVGARHIADAPGPRAMEYGPYDRLRDLIAQHETFWSEVMQRHPDSDLMKWWMQERWDPFFANWTDLIAHGISKVDIDVIGDQFNYLNGLRQEAHQHQIPLPPASDPAMTAVVVGAAVGSAVAISPRSDQVKQIVDLHNVFFLERAALDAAAGRSSTAQFVENEWAPWFSRWSDATADGGPLTEQLVREVARDLSKLRSSAATQGLAVPDIGSAGPRTPTIGYPHPPGEDPLVAQMNRETNERFWRETGYKPGQKLNPRDPADAEMIPRWLSIRYQIAQETNRASEPGAQVAQVAQVSGGHGHHGGGGGGGRRRRGYGGGGWGGGWYGDGYGWDDGDVLIDQVDGDVVIQGDRRPIALMGRWGTEPRRERRMAPRIMPHGGGHGPGGYYRPGARYPGRWWRGGDGTLTWIESDVNLLTDGNPPQAHDDLPPPSTDDVPVTPAEPGDATTVVPGDTPGSVTVIRPPSDDDNASVSPSDAAIATQGAHMYREYRSNPSSNSLIACGALVAPFSEPIKVEFDIDGRGMLLAKLCVGDRCYQGSADISGLIREGIRGARELHDYLHATRSVPLMRRGDVPLMGGWADSITEPVKSVRKIAADAVWRQMDDDHNRTGQPFPFYVFVYWSPRAAGSGALDPGHYEALGFEAIELAKRFIESNLIDPNVSYIAAFELGASGPRMAADTSGSKPDGPKVISSGVAVSGEGNCGVHTYTGVTRPLLDRIFQRLSEKGATITGGNPYNVTGLEGGVELNGSWNPNGTLTIEVVNSNWYASCDRIWGEIDGDLRAIGAQLVVSGEAMIAATGELLVGKLLEQHRQELMAGWWDSVKDIGKGIGKGFMAIQHNTALVVQKFKGPITAAATAVATAYGGPAAGAAAAKFMGPLIDSQVAIGDHKKAAQKIIAAAEEVAKTDPRVRQALDLAHTAVTQAAAGYHIAHTAQQAANGDPAAQKAVAELAQAQASGNPQAKAAIDLANSITGVFGGGSGGDSGVDPNAIEMDQPDASSGDDAAMSGARSIREIASAVARETPGRIVGFVKPRDNAPQSRVFATTDQADDWYGGWLSQSPDAIEYIAYWDKGDPTFPGPLNETAGEGVRVSGSPLVPFLLGLAGGAGGYYGATKLLGWNPFHSISHLVHKAIHAVAHPPVWAQVIFPVLSPAAQKFAAEHVLGKQGDKLYAAYQGAMDAAASGHLGAQQLLAAVPQIAQVAQAAQAAQAQGQSAVAAVQSLANAAQASGGAPDLNAIATSATQAAQQLDQYKGATTKASGSPWSGGRFARPFEPMY